MRKMINNIIYTIGHKLAVIDYALYALEFTVTETLPSSAVSV